MSAIAIVKVIQGKNDPKASAITAYLSVNDQKHVWHWWSQLNQKIKRSSEINRRHDYFTVSNWSFLANLSNQEA